MDPPDKKRRRLEEKAARLAIANAQKGLDDAAVAQLVQTNKDAHHERERSEAHQRRERYICEMLGIFLVKVPAYAALADVPISERAHRVLKRDHEMPLEVMKSFLMWFVGSIGGKIDLDKPTLFTAHAYAKQFLTLYFRRTGLRSKYTYSQVTAYVDTEVKQRYDLHKKVLPKLVGTAQDLKGIILAAYGERSNWATVYERTATVTILLLILYLACRPCELLVAVGYKKSMSWGDCTVLLHGKPDGTVSIGLDLKIRFSKGAREDETQERSVVLLETDDLAMCPVAHILALAEADGFFGERKVRDLYAGRMEPREILAIEAPAELRALQIFRPTTRKKGDNAASRPAHDTGLSVSVAGRLVTRLATAAGVVGRYTMYTVRRAAGNSYVAGGMSPEERRLAMGHAVHSSVFEKYYMNRVVQQDHVALMNGKAGSAVLASLANRIPLVEDLPLSLPPARKQAILQAKEVVQARAAVVRLTSALLFATGERTLRKALDREGFEGEIAAYRAGVKQEEAEIRVRLRAEYRTYVQEYAEKRRSDRLNEILATPGKLDEIVADSVEECSLTAIRDDPTTADHQIAAAEALGFIADLDFSALDSSGVEQALVADPAAAAASLATPATEEEHVSSSNSKESAPSSVAAPAPSDASEGPGLARPKPKRKPSRISDPAGAANRLADPRKRIIHDDEEDEDGEQQIGEKRGNGDEDEESVDEESDEPSEVGALLASVLLGRAPVETLGAVADSAEAMDVDDGPARQAGSLPNDGREAVDAQEGAPDQAPGPAAKNPTAPGPVAEPDALAAEEAAYRRRLLATLRGDASGAGETQMTRVEVVDALLDPTTLRSAIRSFYSSHAPDQNGMCRRCATKMSSLSISLQRKHALQCHKAEHLQSVEGALKKTANPDPTKCPITGGDCDVGIPLSSMLDRSAHVNAHNKKKAQLSNWMSTCGFAECKKRKLSFATTEKLKVHVEMKHGVLLSKKKGTDLLDEVTTFCVECEIYLTGTAVAHEHFAEHVEETLEYCKREPTEPYIIDGIDDYPMRAAVCIFHHADPSAPSRDRAPSWTKQNHLDRHHQAAFRLLAASKGALKCPALFCAKSREVFPTILALSGHLVDVHGIAIGGRSNGKKDKGRPLHWDGDLESLQISKEIATTRAKMKGVGGGEKEEDEDEASDDENAATEKGDGQVGGPKKGKGARSGRTAAVRDGAAVDRDLVGERAATDTIEYRTKRLKAFNLPALHSRLRALNMRRITAGILATTSKKKQDVVAKIIEIEFSASYISAEASASRAQPAPPPPAHLSGPADHFELPPAPPLFNEDLFDGGSAGHFELPPVPWHFYEDSFDGGSGSTGPVAGPSFVGQHPAGSDAAAAATAGPSTARTPLADRTISASGTSQGSDSGLPGTDRTSGPAK